jgi:hypothetical protein
MEDIDSFLEKWLVIAYERDAKSPRRPAPRGQ